MHGCVVRSHTLTLCMLVGPRDLFGVTCHYRPLDTSPPEKVIAKSESRFSSSVQGLRGKSVIRLWLLHVIARGPMCTATLE